MTVHLLGLSLSPLLAVLLAAGLGLLSGAGLGWLVRDYRAWGDAERRDDCLCGYGTHRCEDHGRTRM